PPCPSSTSTRTPTKSRPSRSRWRPPSGGNSLSPSSTWNPEVSVTTSTRFSSPFEGSVQREHQGHRRIWNTSSSERDVPHRSAGQREEHCRSYVCGGS